MQINIDMKKTLIVIFFLISFNTQAEEKKNNFTNEIFNKAQTNGKIVVIHSWQKTCLTCKKQIKILNQAKQEFSDVLFLSYDQETETEIANRLNIQYWTTIVIYKDNKEVYRSIGETNKNKILLAIKSL